MMKQINLSADEIQSGSCRVKWAAGLIKQLPDNHEGRNSWLLNYDKWGEGPWRRSSRGLIWDEHHQCAAAAPKADILDDTRQVLSRSGVPYAPGETVSSYAARVVAKLAEEREKGREQERIIEDFNRLSASLKQMLGG